MRIAADQIARICGVSRGTVDRALNDRPGIHPETKEKILRVAKELGYRPHLLARSLVTGKTMTVGLVLFDLEHRFFTQMATTVIRRLKDHGYFTYVTLTEHNPAEELANLERLAGLNVDGFIIASVNRGREFDRFLAQLHRPVVTFGNYVSSKLPFVSIDDRKATYDAVRFVASKGYRRIIYVVPPLSANGSANLYAQEERLKGYRDALKDSTETEKPFIIKEKTYLDIIDSIDFESGPRTAIVCSTDVYALKVLDRLSSRGVDVPRDLGLMGFDNIDSLEHVRPRLATVDYHIGDIGAKLVEQLLELINGRDGNMRVILKHEIVEGETL